MRANLGGRCAARLPILLVALTLVACAACAGRGPDSQMLPAGLLPAEEQVISGVPFHSQGVGECGPASLAGVLNFHGDPATPEEIAADVLRTNLRGSLTLDLALWPRSRGFTTRWYAGSVRDILDKTGQGLPLLVMLDQGFGPVSANHFVVLLGHAPDAIIINDGARGPGVRMDWSRFLSQWERAGFWTLLVEPAQAGQEDRS
ncbi:cysteine peptidase family C39 domain-containing protein [Desulfocurvibacter africanus]|nr:cysteine peptidase family C39 domain-containing protein [Desulfocurvibacter africanus]